VLQQHIESMLVNDRRKFHIRAYVVSIDNVVYLYTKEMEVRVAGAPYSAKDWSNRSAHITNGAGNSVTTRTLLRLVPELMAVDAPGRVRSFLGRLFARDALGGMLGAPMKPTPRCRSVAVAGLDLMMDSAQRLYV
jgi:hypothetical protein